MTWEFKLRILESAEGYGEVKEACEMFRMSRNTYFNWKKYNKYGGIDLLRKKRETDAYPNRIDQKRLI